MTETPAAENFNSAVIRDFRANGGKVGGQFAGAPLLQSALYPGFGEYQARTSRSIPVIALERTA